MGSSVRRGFSPRLVRVYRLDGHTIELRFNNDDVERKFFYFYPDSKDVFGIGDDYYVKED